METVFYTDKFYVVWKFKSYYVVWKQRVNEYSVAIANMFKSYYVVWKLILSSITHICGTSLNRTM